MRRFHLFEFGDQTWLPPIFREYLVEFLQWQITTYEIYTPLVKKLKSILQRIDCHQIVDICSGGGGPVLQIQEILEKEEDYTVSVILSDKFPNPGVVRHSKLKSNLKIDYLCESVDATAIPNHLTGLHTFFTCFHHFNPDIAVQILKGVVAKRAPIGIFEFTERKQANIIGMLLSPIGIWAQSLKIRPFCWSRYFWIYLAPVIPFIYWWDSTVSHLRTYTVSELRSIVAELNASNYTWDIGTIPADNGGMRITYMIGVPKE